MGIEMPSPRQPWAFSIANVYERSQLYIRGFPKQSTKPSQSIEPGRVPACLGGDARVSSSGQVMVVTHSQETCARILHKFLAQVSCIKFSCKFMQVLVQETFTTNMADKADRDAAAAAVAVIAVLAHEKLKSNARRTSKIKQVK